MDIPAETRKSAAAEKAGQNRSKAVIRKWESNLSLGTQDQNFQVIHNRAHYEPWELQENYAPAPPSRGQAGTPSATHRARGAAQAASDKLAQLERQGSSVAMAGDHG